MMARAEMKSRDKVPASDTESSATTKTRSKMQTKTMRERKTKMTSRPPSLVHTSLRWVGWLPLAKSRIRAKNPFGSSEALGVSGGIEL